MKEVLEGYLNLASNFKFVVNHRSSKNKMSTFNSLRAALGECFAN